MNCSTIDETTFTLDSPAAAVAGVVSCLNDTATFTPNADLNYGLNYTATLMTGITDASDNPLICEQSWDFVTIAAPFAKKFDNGGNDYIDSVYQVTSE